MSQRPEVGFYGKLPSHGDFLSRRAPDSFVDPWDGWLQQCIAATRSALGDRWLDVYLTSPSWRFGCAAGACGPTPVVGVMAPSVDRVGRYFPLTVVAQLPPGFPMIDALESQPFFDCAERVIIETLEADEVDFNRFDDRVAALAEHFEPEMTVARLVLDAGAAATLGTGPDALYIPVDSPARPGRAFEQLAAHRLVTLYDPLVLWWTEGSTLVETSCFMSKGLPSPERFVALLDGSWNARSWRVVPLRLVSAAESQPEPAEQPAAVGAYHSAAGSDVGRVRTKNQDSFLERPEAGIWVVADGLGGHTDGEVASRMVCDALADMTPDSSFEATIDHARRRMNEVNEHLMRLSDRSHHAEPVATTVVALLTRGDQSAVVWAGDSRAYRLRAGTLERLTRDHSLVESDEPPALAPSNVVTRALGAEANVVLDVARSAVQPGDRFLLCSDGLTRTVPDEQLAQSLAGPDIRAAVDELIRAALAAGGPDNVTALVVEART